MGKRIDLKGKRFNRLLVIAYAETIGNERRKAAIWQCQCDCGNSTTARAGDLMSGKTQSCGCFGKERRLESLMSHGMSHTSTYNSWKAMKKRCNNPNGIDYKYYGGRGIKVCSRWKKSFINFLADMGEKPGDLTLERIDNNGDYCPENCNWATRKEQNRDQRTNRMITYGGATKCLTDWAKHLKIERTTVAYRLKHHDVDTAFTMKLRSKPEQAKKKSSLL